MDKIEKILRKLSKKEQQVLILLMIQIKKDFTKIPGLIKLTGYINLYRIRIGRYRIIFKKTPQNIEIIKIGRRNDQTYKNL